MSSTRSWPAAASATAARMASKSSATMGQRVAAPPQLSTCAASTSELYSMMWPGGGSPASAGTSSEPVGMMATRGRRMTRTVAWPAPASAPRSTGRRRWLAGSTSSVATMSSPIARTWCHGGRAARSSMPARPSSSGTGWTCSIMTTALAHAGSGWPVLTGRAGAKEASSDAPFAPASLLISMSANLTGATSLAPTVSSARTA